MDETTKENFYSLYLKILEVQYQYSSRRWTIATFFFSISFAVIGFSYQNNTSQVPLIIQQLTGIFIYWFSYYLFVRLNNYNQFLRHYLKKMEEKDSFCFDFQTKTQEWMKQNKSHKISSTKMLGYFGILYTITIIISWLFIY